MFVAYFFLVGYFGVGIIQSQWIKTHYKDYAWFSSSETDLLYVIDKKGEAILLFKQNNQ